MPTPNEELEADLKRRFDVADFDGVIAAAIAGYGDELYGFLLGLAGDASRADDVFSAMCERMWKGLAKLRWDSSFRVWAYTIARNEFLRSTRESNRARKQVPVSEIASVQQAIEKLRTTTPVYKRTEVKDRFAHVRAQLPPEDHMLLGLRLDRQMSWTEIARILGSEEDSLAREAAALRKRFERLKIRLRELLRE
jgi:RNA polymerase sigma-70 factor (ECF subfamily)